MSCFKSNIEKEAEEAERKAKIETHNKNFDLALLLLQEAKDNYLQINYHGKVQMVDKKIQQVKNLIKYEQKKGATGHNVSTYASSSSYRTTSTTPAKNSEKENIPKETFSEAQQRREMLRKKVEEREKKEKNLRHSNAKIQIREERKKRALTEKEKRLMEIEEKKRREEERLEEANNLLERGKELLDSKKFDESKQTYRSAIKIFRELQWFSQVDVLIEEVKNIEKYKTEYLKKKKAEELKKKKEEEAFNQRVQGIMAEKQKLEAERLKRINALPPHMKRSVEKAKMLMKKADREIEHKKYELAIKRLEYAIELYKSVPEDKLDLSKDVKEIEDKINSLKAKM